MKTGILEAIRIKRAKRGPMDRVSVTELVVGRGICGNANQGSRRQVTIIDAAVWERLMTSLDARLEPSTRRANLLVRGIDLRNSRGRILQVGACRMRIYGETKPCERMEEELAACGQRCTLGRGARSSSVAR
jgi:MOSC domain-containing protein YiiM